MKSFFSWIFLFVGISSFAGPVQPKDLVSCANKEMKYTLNSSLYFVESGYQILPIFNKQKEMVGYIPTKMDGQKKELTFHGIELCGNFQSSFSYNEDGSELAKNWITKTPKKFQINQDEAILRLVVQNYVSPNRTPNEATQLVKVTFEAIDMTESNEADSDGVLVGKGEFFLFIPRQ